MIATFSLILLNFICIIMQIAYILPLSSARQSVLLLWDLPLQALQPTGQCLPNFIDIGHLLRAQRLMIAE